MGFISENEEHGQIMADEVRCYRIQFDLFLIEYMILVGCETKYQQATNTNTFSSLPYHNVKRFIKLMSVGSQNATTTIFFYYK